MKSVAFLLGLVNLVVAGPFAYEQIPISEQITHPGFTLDLDARRLVQFEGQEPKWLTELEKVLIITQLSII
jgi:leucyl aminopeptidase